MLVHVLRLHFLGMYDRSLVQPSLNFPYDVAPFVQPPKSSAGALCHLGGLGTCALGIALGVIGRAPCLLFALLYSYFVLCERTMFNNHYYLYVLFAAALALVRADHAFVLKRQRSEPLRAWQLWLLRLQVCIVYWYAGVAKCNADWILHAEPMVTKLRDEAASYNPSLRWLLSNPNLAHVVSVAGLALDLGVVPLLLHPRTRAIACSLSVIFHIGMTCLLAPGPSARHSTIV